MIFFSLLDTRKFRKTAQKTIFTNFYLSRKSSNKVGAKNFLRTQVRNCFAPTLFAPPLLDLIVSVVGMKRCKKTIFFCIPRLRVDAKIQGGCETKGGCKGPKRPTLNTPMHTNLIEHMIYSCLL